MVSPTGSAVKVTVASLQTVTPPPVTLTVGSALVIPVNIDCCPEVIVAPVYVNVVPENTFPPVFTQGFVA